MRFLNGLFWFLLAVIVSIFTYGNWKHVQINLWSGLIADVNLPLLLLLAFLAGFIPTALWHQAVKWRLKQRLATAERNAAMYTTAPIATPDTPLTTSADPLPAPAVGDPLPLPSTSGDLVERARPRPAKA